jgi:hypothetical protein
MNPTTQPFTGYLDTPSEPIKLTILAINENIEPQSADLPIKVEQQLILKMAVFAPKWRVWAVAAP